MRDRLFEFLPLLLVGVVLVGYQLLHDTAPTDSKPARLPQPTPAAVQARPLTPAVRAPLAQPACSNAEPRFVGGFALLRAAVGARMGDAVECEHVVNASGDTQQSTTTGLAYYLKGRNVPSFTNGYDHWALMAGGGLVRWAGNSAMPPQ